MGILKIFGFLKLFSLIRIMKQNGGFRSSLHKEWRFDTLKDGRFVGSDTFGNKYFENPYYFIGRSRWVEIYDNAGWNYDASMVTPDWYGWLHYKTDKVPCQDPAKQDLYCNPYTHRWLMPHKMNLTGTELAYYPYSTTRARIYVWDVTWGTSRINGSYRSSCTISTVRCYT